MIRCLQHIRRLLIFYMVNYDVITSVHYNRNTITNFPFYSSYFHLFHSLFPL